TERTGTQLTVSNQTMDYTDPKNPIFAIPAADTTLIAQIVRQPLKTTGPEKKVDPLDINMPASITLELTSPNDGVIQFAPSPGSDPIEQMGQAPESGYTKTMVLDESRLKMLRDDKQDFVLDRNVIFFFHANGHYGKGIIHWSAANTDAFALSYTLLVQP